MPVSVFWTIVLVIVGVLIIAALVLSFRDNHHTDAAERTVKDRDPGADK